MGQQGALLRDRYRLQEVIGKSTMAGVWQAVDEQLGRAVAVKILRPVYAADPSVRQRFCREARRAAALDHPSIVPVLDHGLDGETAFIVTELVDGLDLDMVLKRHGRLPVDHALRIAAAVADALQAAHDRRLIHRDIKPANILLDVDGEIRVVDFGLTRALGVPSTGRAASGASTRYGSPEQLAGGRIGRRSDVYSLGLVLHELLTGETAFQGTTADSAGQAREAGPPPAPSTLVPDLPDGLDDIVMRALAATPRRRYGSALEFRDAIERWWQSSRPPIVTPVVSSVSPHPAAVLRDAADRVRPRLSRWSSGPPFENRRTQVLGALMPVAAVLVVATVGWSVALSPVTTPALDGSVLGATATPNNAVAFIGLPDERLRTSPVEATPAAVASPKPKATPRPTPRATAERTPRPTPRPTPKPTKIPVAAVTEPPAPTPTPVPVRDPAQTVILWYTLVAEQRFDEAAQLSSERLTGNHVLWSYIERHFSRTTGLEINRAEVVASDPAAGWATVAVEITEFRSVGPSPIHSSGYWDLVMGPEGWLLDEPHFSGSG